jgi:hypothetical protein
MASARCRTNPGRESMHGASYDCCLPPTHAYAWPGVQKPGEAVDEGGEGQYP